MIPEIPVIGRGIQVLGSTMLVMMQCVCGAEQAICLIQAQKAMCEPCGRVWWMSACAWADGKPLPTVDIHSTPSRAELLAQH